MSGRAPAPAASVLVKVLRVILPSPACRQLSAGRRVRRQISEHELNGGENEFAECGRFEQCGGVAQGAVEYATFPITLDPANGVVVVRPDALPAAHIRLIRVDAE